MSIGELLAAATNDPALFWSALGAVAQATEALAVLFSAGVIIFQLRRMREESLRDRMGGVTTAIQILGSDLFRKITRETSSGAVIQGVDWDELLDALDQVGMLVTQGFTDRSLLMKLKGDEFRSIDKYLRDNALTVKLKTHPDAQSLLEHARSPMDHGGLR